MIDKKEFSKVGNFVGKKQEEQKNIFCELLLFCQKYFVRLQKWCLRFPDAKPLPQEGREAEIIRLINKLNKIEKIPPKELRIGADASIAKITNFLRRIALIPVIIIMVALGLLLFARFFNPIYLIIVAKTADIALIVLALVWVALDTFSPLSRIVFVSEFEFLSRQFELSHDLRMAKDLAEFDLNILQIVDKWLEIKIERLRFRMLIIFGGSDKIALFALVGLAWAMRKFLQSNEEVCSYRWMTYVIAWLIGITIGGIFANVTLNKLLYQKDIVALAVHEKKERCDN